MNGIGGLVLILSTSGKDTSSRSTIVETANADTSGVRRSEPSTSGYVDRLEHITLHEVSTVFQTALLLKIQQQTAPVNVDRITFLNYLDKKQGKQNTLCVDNPTNSN